MQIWRSFWLLVMDRKMSSLTYFDFVVQQIGYETVEQIIQVALMNLKALINYYIPVATIPEKKTFMFAALLKLLLREDLEPSIRIPIVD